MVIHFSGGVTGVVGPNGSGKSNISDGIRWVLGETSAKSLRGGSMKDVIFSGCETRKASTFAEVTIELDNRRRFLSKIDEDKVTVTRRATINGKSDFFINEQPARLKDIQDLFLDSGLGSNSYSMIGQEQTKRLLSEKTEDRRAIFEEASGIVKMKNQKETTEERLQKVEQDFVRLNDILNELNKQVTPLRKQSEKAKQYLGVKKVLDETETDFLSFKYKRIFQSFQGLSETLLQKSNELEESNTILGKLEEESKELKNRLKLINDTIFSSQEEKAALKQQIDSLENQINRNKERIEQGENELVEIKNEILEIEEKFSVSVEEFNTKKNRFQELERLIYKAKLDKDDLTKEIFHLQVNLDSSKEKVETLRSQITSLYNEFQEAKFRFEQQNRDEEKMLAELDTLKEKKNIVDVESKNAKTNLDKVKSMFEKNSSLMQNLNMEHQLYLNQLNLKQKEMEELLTSITNLETALIKDKTVLDSLESSLENFEGYYEGVKNVLKNRHLLTGVLDVVSNLFTVKSGFETALDSLLTSVSQYIATDTINNAKSVVNFLKKEHLGRATFIPLDDLSPRIFSSEDLEQINHFDGIYPAISVIEFQKELEPLFKHLLGKYLIAKDMDTAVAFYQNTKIKVKISTLDGDIIQPGTISGGTKNKKGLISKRKEMELLKGTIQNNEDILIKHKEKEKKIKDIIGSLILKKDNISSALEKEKEDNRQIQLDLERMQMEFNRVKDATKEQEITEKDLKYRYSESKKLSSSLFTKHREKEALHNQKNDELTILLKDIKEQEFLLESKKQLETNTLIGIEKNEEEKRGLTDFITEQENGKDSFEKRLEFLQTKKYSIETKNDSLLVEIETIMGKLNEISPNLSALETELGKNQQSKETIQINADEIESRLVSLRSSLSELNDEVHKFEIQKTNMENEQEKILKRAQEAYHITDKELLNLQVVPINEEATEKEINSLIKELKSIGSVNLDSINDFDQLNERYQSEKSQLEDVKEAKKDLEMLLKDVSREMTERFTSTFKEVAKHFEKIFVELFGGGQAKLGLEDPKKPLTSHILITAQPPGKKPRKIELLSGGEKNLTVCALIFAIIKAKPSPFVYLDEIDAPFDDANVSRFAYYLKKMSEQTQFIVVTHRKGTMMAADSLFGITQEIEGITTVLPYHLEQPDYLEPDEYKEG